MIKGAGDKTRQGRDKTAPQWTGRERTRLPLTCFTHPSCGKDRGSACPWINLCGRRKGRTRGTSTRSGGRGRTVRRQRGRDWWSWTKPALPETGPSRTMMGLQEPGAQGWCTHNRQAMNLLSAGLEKGLARMFQIRLARHNPLDLSLPNVGATSRQAPHAHDREQAVDCLLSKTPRASSHDNGIPKRHVQRRDAGSGSVPYPRVSRTQHNFQKCLWSSIPSTMTCRSTDSGFFTARSRSGTAFLVVRYPLSVTVVSHRLSYSAIFKQPSPDFFIRKGYNAPHSTFTLSLV